MNNKFFFIFLTLIFCIALVSSQSALVRTGEIDIQVNNFGSIQQNQNQTFYFHTYNNTQLLGNDTVSCDFDLYSQDGVELYDRDDLDFTSPNEFYILVNSANFSTVGEYNVLTECNSSVQAGAVEFGFYVTPTGKTAGDFTTVLIWLIFIIAVVGNWTIFILILVKLVTANETIFGVLSAWGLYILMIISSYLSGFLLTNYVTQLSNNFLDLLRYTNVILPLISLVITMIWKGIKQKKPIGIDEITGRRPF